MVRKSRKAYCKENSLAPTNLKEYMENQDTFNKEREEIEQLLEEWKEKEEKEFERKSELGYDNT